MRKAYLAIFAIIALSFIVGIYFYPLMPDKMASHWNFKGEVDKYMSKFWGLFLMPMISLLMLILFIIIPKIDPLKANIEKFRKYFDLFIVLIISFLFYIYALSVFWNFGVKMDMNIFIIPAVSILFFYCGVLITNAKQNWFIGIRTPWTLSSKEVWNKTHKIGGLLFKISAGVSLLGVFFENYIWLFVLAPVIFSSIYAMVYSYLEFRKKIVSS